MRHPFLTGILMTLTLLACAATASQAGTVHIFNCNQCHTAGLSLVTLGDTGNNLCLKCHVSGSLPVNMNDGRDWVSPTRIFTPHEASDHFGTASATGFVPMDQVSHIWASKKDRVPAAGAQPASTNLYRSRYGISTNKITCSRCHNPHLLREENAQLLRIDNSQDQVCRDCHRSWDIPNVPDTNALETHPIIADYPSLAAANPGRFRQNLLLVNNEGVRLVNGTMVSCTSCHQPHWADSNSTTADGPLAALATGDGHMLRSDGPKSADANLVLQAQKRSNLCQSCHLYQLHGNMADGGTQVGCLDCHSGHVYDPVSPNRFILRKVTNSDVPLPRLGNAPGTAYLGNYTAPYAKPGSDNWSDRLSGSASGFCESCHGDVQSAPIVGRSSGHETSSGSACNSCHYHHAAGWTHSFQPDASAETCGDCHGFPPYRNVPGDRITTPANSGGYAAVPPSADEYPWNYLNHSDSFKDESKTGHLSHAGGSSTYPSYYYVGHTGTENCNVCHGNGSGFDSRHRDNSRAASFRDIQFNEYATAYGALSPSYNTVNWTCQNTYCHSNGGPRNGAGGRTFSTSVSPAWVGDGAGTPGPANGAGLGATFNDPQRCSFCHGNSWSTMLTKGNSARHRKHVDLLANGGRQYTCNLCHVYTAASTTALQPNATRGDLNLTDPTAGLHIDEIADIHFDNSYNIGAGTLGAGSYGSVDGTCSVYCHSNGKGVRSTPDWDVAASGACGTCHGVTYATLAASGSHGVHINPSKANIRCDSCHGSGAAAGTHSGHVDGVITRLSNAASCNSCHGIETVSPNPWDVTPTWGNASSIDCRTCHTGTNLTSYVNASSVTVSITTGNGLAKTQAQTTGHNRPSGNYPVTNVAPANKNCTACHTTIGTGHVDGLGNGDLLLGGFSCEACHTAAGAWSAQATVRVRTHDNRDPAYTQQKRADFTKLCVACHDPHGTVNIAMIERTRTVQNAKDASGNYGGDVVFTAFTGADSFDEVDSTNTDDLCATCHTTTTHNRRTNIGTHHEGENCATICHTHNSNLGGFMPSGGEKCDDCHGNPPATGAHLAHTTVTTHQLSEDRSDCEQCHPGAASFGLLHSNATLDLASGITATTCTAACHASSVGDGFWTDTNGLACNACHGNPPAGTNHAKHISASIACATCHGAVDAAGTMYPNLVHKVAKDTTNEGTILRSQGKDYINPSGTAVAISVTTWVNSAVTNDAGNSCANLACHNPSGTTYKADWDVDVASCTLCHSATNPDSGKGTPGSHGPHMGAATNFGLSITCGSCHPANTGNNAHLNGAVALNGFTYSASLTDYTSATFGRCTTTTCHNNGRGTAVQTPPWGTVSNDCTICHNNGSGAPQPGTGRHNAHVANTGYIANPNACGKCHLLASATQITATSHINSIRNVGAQITDMDLATGGNQLVAPGGWNGTCANTCHLVDTTGTWTDSLANKLACLECHTSGKSAGGSLPTSGLHSGTLTISQNTHDDSFKVTRNEATPSGTCLTCHTATPSTGHMDGSLTQAQTVLAAAVGYTAGATPTCGPTGAMVSCHDDRGAWKRKWSDTARNDATPYNECGNCHGDFDRGWVTGIALRHSNDPQVHGSHDGVNKCSICHTYDATGTYYTWATQHRDGTIQLNDGMRFIDDGATVHCEGCHTTPLGLNDGQYSFQDTLTGSGGLSRWGRQLQPGPEADCTGCHDSNGMTHTDANESAAVHAYHTGSPLSPGCGACHANSGPGGANHHNGTVEFGGTYLSLASYTGAFTNTNCSSANGCHNSQLNSWRNDTLAGCADCHSATGKLLNQGGYPPTSGEHAAHMGNNAYVGTTASNDCDDCHGAGSSTGSHGAAHSDGVRTMANKITQPYRADGTCTNTCHATVDGRDWTSNTTLACVDCHSGSYIGKANKSHVSGLHATTSALAHDEAFPRPGGAPDGSCTSCHTAINLTTPASHVDGVNTDPNTAYGLFAAYTSATSSCAGAGVASNCHSDGGDWRRRWNGAVDEKPGPSHSPGAAVCNNCHGDFVNGWRWNEANASTTDHTDPNGDLSEQMTVAGHNGCQACHGWGHASYNRTWNSGSPGHGDGLITMNGPAAVGSGYDNATGGCALSCHGDVAGRRLNSNSGWTVGYGDFGGANSCEACHAAKVAEPRHAKHSFNSPSIDADLTDCARCHPNAASYTPAGGHPDHKNLTLNLASGITAGTCSAACHASSAGDGSWSDSNGLNCEACHYYAASPTGPGNTAHARPLSTSHNKHFNKGKGCSECHVVPVDTSHITTSGANDGERLAGRGQALQDEAFVTRANTTWLDTPNTCSGSGIGLGCHASGTPDWDDPITACTVCHSNTTNATFNPTSGLHNAGTATRHDGALQAGSCVNCHAASSPSSLHQDGTKQNAASATFTWESTKVLSYSRSNDTCAANCHRDAGAWKRKWSTVVDAAASGGSGQAVCGNCHGSYGAWNEGTVHYRAGGGSAASKGSSHTDADPARCEDCHGYPSAASHNSNNKIDFSGNGATYTLAWGTHTTNPGWYCASCHNDRVAEDASDDGSHTFPDSLAFPSSNKVSPQGVVYVDGISVPEGSCTTCHGSIGNGGAWPQGSSSPNRAGEHDVHVWEIAKKRYGTSSPTAAHMNTTCNYCHPANGHSGDGNVPAEVSMTDSNNDGTPETNTGTRFKRIVSPFDIDEYGFWRPTPGTCSTTACHASAPYTPHWYGDTVPPGNVTLAIADGPEPRSLKLTWTAPGNDGTLDGTAYRYDIRMGASSAIATNYGLTDNFVGDVPTVKRKGDPQEVIIRNLTPGSTYYFSLRSYDENVIGNPGTNLYGTSNTVSRVVPADTTPPVLTGSPTWYGLDWVHVLDAPGTVELSWTRAEDHSMPITYDIWWSTGAITYGTPQASTRDTRFRVTGLTNGQSYNFAVRARDAFNNRDTNTVVLQAIPQGYATVPKANLSYYANGTATTNIPMLATVHTVNGTTSTYPAVFIGPTTFTAVTDIIASGFTINVTNSNVVSTLRAELGYITGTNTFNSFNSATAGQTILYATDVTVAKRANRLVNFKFNGATRRINAAMVPLNVKLGVRVSVLSGTVTSIGWGPTSKGGVLTFAQQPINSSPTTPTITTLPVSGANVSFHWAPASDSADGVADTVHYDVYGSANGGADGFPHVIALGLTTNATAGAPLVWNTQESGIALSGAVTNVQVRVEAGDAVNGKTLSHTAHTSSNLTVNNAGDNVAPGAIHHFEAETRPKQGSVYLSWTAPGDDGDNNGRASYYDIRWASTVIDNDTKYNAATPVYGEPYPLFGGEHQGYEVLGLADGDYFFAIKAFDEGGKASPLAWTTAPEAAGPKCGICHSTPPDETATKGNHAKHGYTLRDCANCHGTEAEHFHLDHQDGLVKLGWKTADPQAGTFDGNTITYTQNGRTIYSDTSGGGFNAALGDPGDRIDNGSCFNWSSLGVSGCHGPAASALWDANPGNVLVCSACHGDNSRVLDNYQHSFDDPSEDIKASPPVDNHGYDGTGLLEGERKYVGAHVAHLNYSFRLSKGNSCRLCHGASRPGVGIHADGYIDIELDLSAAGPDAWWNPGIDDQGPAGNTAGTCGNMSPESCHPSTATPRWDSAEVFNCTKCHGFDGVTPSHVTDPNKNINLADNDPDSGDPMPGNCTWCHVGGHPMEKKVTAITKAAPAVVTTENNHNLTTGDKVTIHTTTGMTQINNKTFIVTVIDATSFSLQGSNTTTYGTFDYGTWIEGNGTGIILVANDSRVGINYKSGGIHLKANIGNRGEVSSEAELCWGCHTPNNISEWGADNGPANSAQVKDDPSIGGNGPFNYNYGTLSATPNGPGNWIGATWTSAVTGTYGFGYKTGTIRSTHSTDPTGTAALTGSAYNYSETVDAVEKIRCSNCHDVHNTNKSPLAADGLDPSGPPYLRGTWKTNPYKEDGAPQAGQTYLVQGTAANPGYGYGQVPRANPSTTNAMGGYWIDQNSNYPTSGWTYDSSAGLCQLCHSKTVDNLDQVSGENLWLSANGHANSALGGSGTGAANIFKHGVSGGRNGTIGASGGSGANPNIGAWMGFENTVHSGTTDYGYGPRSGDGSYLTPLQTPNRVKMSVLVFAWGNAVDSATVEVGYHSFSCSKCHNPHASRLPKLMITNCLDVNHNTWDYNYDDRTATGTVTTVNANTTGKWLSFGTATSSWSTKRLSHLSTAQNCHRYIDINNDKNPDEPGWNRLTPWRTLNTYP